MNFITELPNQKSWLHNTKSSIDLSWNQNQIDSHFDNNKGFNCFCEVDMKAVSLILGHIIFSKESLIEFEILHLGTIKEYRNQGIATKLMEFCEQDLKKKCDKATIYLEVRENNQIAIKFYRKLGYKVYSKRKKYYKNLSNLSSENNTAILLKKIINE